LLTLFSLFFLGAYRDFALLFEVFGKIQKHHAALLDIFLVVDVHFHVEFENLVSFEEAFGLPLFVLQIMVGNGGC
jgi:hypothetical protein